MKGKSLFKRVVPAQWEAQEMQADAFVRAHIPLWKQSLMLRFAFTRKLFKYELARNKDNPRQLTLLCRGKVVATNF